MLKFQWWNCWIRTTASFVVCILSTVIKRTKTILAFIIGAVTLFLLSWKLPALKFMLKGPAQSGNIQPDIIVVWQSTVTKQPCLSFLKRFINFPFLCTSEQQHHCLAFFRWTKARQLTKLVRFKMIRSPTSIASAGSTPVTPNMHKWQ